MPHSARVRVHTAACPPWLEGPYRPMSGTIRALGQEWRRALSACSAVAVDLDPTPTDGRPRSRRRRGALLEAEILDAAWEELRQRGWSGFRIEGVAARSGTGKAAIYARWRNRHELVRAAVTHSQRHTAGTWTSQGDLRTDLVTYLTSVAAFVSGPDGEALRALVSATPSDGQAVGASWQERIEVPSLIVEAAQRRGDLELGTVDPLVLRLGQMVVGQIWLMSGQLQSGIAEHVVDAIWLPALRVAAGAGTGS